MLEEGSVVSGTTRLPGGEMKVQGAAEIPDLELAGARVDLVADNQYSKLTIGRLNGEGKFYLNSEVAASHSDELEGQNGHGSFGIAMTDRSYEEVFPDKVHIVLLSTDESKPLPERIARQANKVGLYNALTIGDIMLQGAQQKK